MTEQIKYEAVFGDQSVFNPGDKTTVMVTERTLHPGFQFLEHWDCYKKVLGRDERIIATRRIIKTPVWTVADQQAGRLPEVGCEIAGDVTGINKVLFSSDEFVVTLSQGGAVGKYSKEEVFDYFSPIESPEEKAARLRSEWCNRAMDYSTIQQLYDAMLSGELAVPVAPEQNK